MQIDVDDIKITERIRKDKGDISSLADNINEIGLLHPIVINEANELVCGYRRVLAFKRLQRKEIPCAKINLTNLAKGEFSENAFRKDFTISEMVEIKRALEPETKREAEIRIKVGKPAPKLGKGRSTEIIARALGIGHTSLEKAEKLVDAAGSSEKFKQILDKVDKGKTSLDRAYKQILQSPQAHKDKKQVGEQNTSQAQASTTADEGKKRFTNIINDDRQETTNNPTPKEQTTKKSDLPVQSNDLTTIESFQNKIRILEKERDYLFNKLAEKSPDFLELYDENEQLKEIERERIKHGDFNTAASLPSKNELQQKIDSLEERIKEQDNLLAKNRFEAELELKEQLIPLIIFIDRVRAKAKVTIDAAKMKRLVS